MPQPHELLDEAMKARRLQLRMNWRQLAEAAGISYEALRAIRRGDYRPAELTAQGLDDALQWQSGSVYKVLDGGQPTPLGAAASAPVHTGRPASALERELAFAARVMAAAVKESGLSPDEADEAWRLAKERIVRTHVPPAGGEEADPPEDAHHRAV